MITRRLLVATTVTALLTAAAGGAVRAGASTTGTPAPSCTTALTCGADLAEATDLETKVDDHLRWGFMAGSVFGSDAQTPGDVVGSGGYGDSGLWTGVYLGGESFRYALAKKNLATDATSAYWQLQLSQSTARIQAMVEAFHRNVNIAVAWRTTTKVPPTVNPSNSLHPVDFGGGVFQGEKGMLMRACTPAGEPLGIQDQGPDDRVYGPWRWEDGKSYYCETSPSRDTYAGTTFGMLTAFDLVSPDFPAMRDMLRTDLLSIGSYLVEHGWGYINPDGYITTGNTFDGFVTPLMEDVPMAQLNITNAADHVADAGGSAADKLKWDALWKAELAAEGPQLAASLAVDAAQPHDSYYKFNLHHLTGFNLARTTTGATRHLVLQAMGVLDKTTGDDGNAHFEAITYSMTDEASRLADGITHLEQWIDYRSNTIHGQAVRNSAFCGGALYCMPNDDNKVVVDGHVLPFVPGTDQTLRASRPLPVAQRAPTDFLWQRDPTQLDGQQPADYREPGIDYLTPYWMLRYYTEDVTPPATPFPLAPPVAFL